MGKAVTFKLGRDSLLSESVLQFEGRSERAGRLFKVKAASKSDYGHIWLKLVAICLKKKTVIDKIRNFYYKCGPNFLSEFLNNSCLLGNLWDKKAKCATCIFVFCECWNQFHCCLFLGLFQRYRSRFSSNMCSMNYSFCKKKN